MPAGRKKQPITSHQFGIRLLLTTMKRAQALAPRISPIGAHLTCTDVLRMAIERGLDLIEHETNAAELRVQQALEARRDRAREEELKKPGKLIAETSEDEKFRVKKVKK